MTGPTDPGGSLHPSDPARPVGPAGADHSAGAGHDDWLPLDRRTITSTTVVVAAALVAAAAPAAIGMLVGGLGIGWVLLWTVGGVVVGTVATAIAESARLTVTRYRVDAHRIERRVRFLSSTTSSLSTHRVRNVEITADVVQRRLGIATLRLASGETDGSRMTLAALDRAEAEHLRRRLLADRADADTHELAHLDPRWVRYAPASLMTPVFGLVGFGIVLQVADWFNAVPAVLEWVWDRVGGLPLPVLAIGVVALTLAIGTVAATVLFVENWWGMRLERHRDGSLELRRGLVVGRHATFDGRRVRGVTLHEPPGFRALGAARLDVIATGVGIGNDENGKPKQSPALVPASPRDVAAGVAAEMLGTPVPGTAAGTAAVRTEAAKTAAASTLGPEALRSHPPVARRRRAVRAVAATLALTGIALVPALMWPWLWCIPVAVAAVGGTVAAWAVVDNYRGLGHAVGGTVVTVRKGSLLRRTDVLYCDGILGWNVRRTPFQRRAGLVTLVATSAGGGGAFRLPDVAEAEAHEVWSTAGDVWDHLAEPRD
ncbi:putative membrane protein [Dietzia kunjamensis subsp. schimae]|uniref:Membrane protein n=1 Tax=Dietzia kunjamensis subsp. schimae TaxID=498198 RepID=A0ABY1MWX0_9ACTN|nr:PH domain-containing protein [Dietzia kunjamensis]SMO41289.1 putative membrane protein [Dietzia kunjamensis subsp. schimae]